MIPKNKINRRKERLTPQEKIEESLQESEVGIGTIFHIYLPVSKTEIQQEPILDKAKGERAEEASTVCRGNILLMDDEDVVRLAVAQHLRNLKYEVKAASDLSHRVIQKSHRIR